MFYKFYLVLVCCCPGMTHSLFSQSETDVVEAQEVMETIDDVSFFELTGDYGLTIGSFKNTIDRNIGGFTVGYLNQVESKRTYALVGLQLSRYNLGSRSGVVSSGGFDFRDRTSTISYTLQGVYRVFAPFFYMNLEPFAEVALGPQFLYTGTSTTFFDELSTSEFNFEETAFGVSFGFSLGATLKVYEQYMVLFKIGYHGSNAMTYLVPRNDLNFQFPVDNFELRNSQLSYLKFQLGAAYSF